MPKIKFTAMKVKNLKPANKMVEFFDSERKHGSTGSFGLRVSPKGRKTWFLMYVPDNGKQKKMVLGVYPDLSLADARKKATNVISAVNNGLDPQAEKSAYKVAETFTDVWADYIKSPWYLKKGRVTQRAEQLKFDRLLKDTIGPMKVQGIRKKHLSPVMDKLAQTAPVNANRLFSLLNFVFRFALSKDLVDVHPMFGMMKPGGRETARKRYLKADEIKILWKAFDTCTPAARDVFRLILLLAQRPGETMAIESCEVDLEKNIWTIPAEKTKTNTEHLVPLSKQALAIIEPLLGEKYLFPSHGSHLKDTSRSRYALWKKVDIEDWTAHDLRRTARTLMGELKVRPDIAERILNHSRGKIERTYDHHSYIDEKRVALDRLGNEIERITTGRTAGKVVNLR